MEINWEEIRKDFPMTERVAYLNSAAAGPPPRIVSETAARFYSQMLLEGDERWDEWLVTRERIRERVAKLINAESDEIGFTTNTSHGMNLIVDALFDHGEVFSCDLEFPVTTITWMHRGTHVHLIKTRNGELHAEDIHRTMNERTAVISLSHVQYSNGFRAALEEIGATKGEHLFVVNASQSAGAFEIDVRRMKIDALCATGHKWMLAGYGSGFVYLSRDLLERTRPRSVSWLSVEDPFAMRNDQFQLKRDAAARSEQGCPHFAGIFALGAAVDYMMKIGVSKIERRVLVLNRLLTSRLQEAGWKVLSPLRDEWMRSAETLVEAENPAQVTAHLKERGVAVTEKPQGIRLATHFFNNESDIERLIEALEEARESLRA